MQESKLLVSQENLIMAIVHIDNLRCEVLNIGLSLQCARMVWVRMAAIAAEGIVYIPFDGCEIQLGTI